MKNVLIITHTFPPVGGGGVIRVTKFTKYLPQYGWNPIVVTADCTLPQYDASLTREVAHVRVVRTRTSFFHRFYGRLVRRMVQQISTKGQAPFMRFAYIFHRLWSKMLDRILIPDRQILWALPAFFAARRIMRSGKIHAVYTISVPHSITFVGALLKYFYGIPWVADFRDVWTDRWHHEHTIGWIRLKVEQWMERRMIRFADHVITATKPACDYFLQRAQPIQKEKFTVITNGFDPDDFQHLQPLTRHASENVICFTSVGVMTRDYHYEALQRLLHSFERLTAQGKIPSNGYKVEFLSSINPNVFRTKESDIIVNYVGFLPHEQALAHCAATDVLFFILHPDFASNSYPGKLFEYMALGKPILGLTVSGLAAQFVEQHHLGWIADDRDPTALDAAILRIYTLWKTKKLPTPSQSSLDLFDRRLLTKQLASVLDTV